MTAEIYEFTGLTKLPLDPNKVIGYAEDLKECVVIGIDADGEIYVAGSSGDVANVVYLIELGKKYMLELGDEQ
ncbi:MAG: hypothetical protein Unbinned5081contig1002_10 [Prokaryotic dsDNA virus sp.]|nr:MAG: hypothetical protein Unbinned5081contig1002_10 [Prokaryotic dsDNA virus sp.]|tara:strand:+ start:4820 stop:5038 length:219 start_codon:yes stop_codon:yes gene_type:complete